ncbi:hypothetical protein DM02DRAFT_621677 [Periconia macrospinosa]|uniref:F-box domain-containing protein n=1 Tax=Periconia macrospinosa TaxID=97972 RepID=A0A2V1EC66_9PLEO|nr:hypothetical protein DM02DRAFT_621677 [Periconia macrospinosa]
MTDKSTTASMPNIDTLPPEISRLIASAFPQSHQGPALTALCQTSKTLCAIYQPVIFEFAKILHERQIHSFTYALVCKPSLAKVVTKASILFHDHPFRPEMVRIHHSVKDKLKTMDFWSYDWQKKLDDMDPRALCGLLIALLPELTEFKMTTKQMTTITYSPDDQDGEDHSDEEDEEGVPLRTEFRYFRPYDGGFPTSVETISDVLISARDLFGIAAETCPNMLPKMQHIHTWKSVGLIPMFVLALPSLKTVEFEIGRGMVLRNISNVDLLPSHAPAFKTITSVTIRIDTDIILNELYQPQLLVCVRGLLERLKNLKRIMIILPSPIIVFNDLTQVLSGAAKSLEVTYGLCYFKPGIRRIADHATIPPMLHLTESLVVPEAMLVSKKGSQLTLLESKDASAFLGVKSLTITNATKLTFTLLVNILQYRLSTFHNLRRLHISYVKTSCLLDHIGNDDHGSGGSDESTNEDDTHEGSNAEEGDGHTSDSNVAESIEAAQKLHEHLCNDLMGFGIHVTRGYDT